MPDPGEPFTTPELPITGRRTAPVLPPHRQALHEHLNTGTETVRAELLRADTKANSLLAFAGVLLAGGLTVLGAGKLSGPAATAGWAAVAVVATAVVLLAVAIRPNLRGDFGFVRWAHLPDARAVLDDLITDQPSTEPLERQAGDLRWLSRALFAKYIVIRWAVHLIVAGLGIAAAAAALAMGIR